MGLTALKVQGPFRGVSGYDHHTREFVRALHRLGVEIELVDLPIWGSGRLPAENQDPLFSSLSRPVGASVFLRFAMPHQALVEPGVVNVNYTMFEATRIHPSWVAQAHAYDLVVVPTEACREAWIASGAPANRIRICPLGIDAELYGQPAEPWPLGVEPARVRFLNVSELNSRKNLLGIVRAWLNATQPADDAVLVIKLATDPKGWKLFRRDLDDLPLAEGAPIHVLGEQLADAEMPRLYAAATHYVSLSFAEGWDLAMMEAAASGLELVAPWHSAYRTYLDPSTAHLIDSAETPIVWPANDAYHPLFRGASWWAPDERQAADVIRAIVAGTAPAKTSPRERILREFSWDAAAGRLLELLTEAERRQGRRLARLRRGYGGRAEARGRARSDAGRGPRRP